ncbi:hypothetical protein PMZ80_009981 [Knufia obscura]|uniref:Uncharacterized protein n=2 Tax=Knufia TaxID=430999 RepID=A0AAN8I5U9_9EURO|nr:hypothetical protein PMZ80_009981 [Knufia obscura]KAK5956072.1 hypothetical protein OHC33_002645 [Knufia fluminis]
MTPTNTPVPGIQGLEDGQPWPQDSMPLFRRPLPAMKLDSFHSVLHRASEKLSSALFSPVSMTSTIRASQEQQTPRQSRESTVVAVSPSSIRDGSTRGVVVPEMAHISSGGWFNPSNWFCNTVCTQFGHLSLDELEHVFFTRETRPVYGENHTSTRGKRARDAGDFDDVDALRISGPKKFTENHKVQERDRRNRHRVFQKEVDECTPTSIYELAEKMLPEVKQYVKSMPEEYPDNNKTSMAQGGKAQRSNTTAKKTGKDDQLLSAALFSWLSGFVILRERQVRVEAEDRVQRLENELKEAHARRIEAEDRAARLAVDNKYQAEEISYLQQQLDHRHDSRRGSATSSSFLQPQLPPPTASRKRLASDMDYLLDNNNTGEKRRYFAVDPMQRLPQRGPGYHLPPSPSPSCDESSSSFCCT